MIGWRTLAATWDRFWFAPASPLPMAVFRILFGLVALAIGLHLAPDWYLWFGERGVLSAESARAFAAGTRIDLFGRLPAGDAWTLLVLAAYMAAGLGLTLGWRTRASAAVLLVCVLGMHARNPLIMNGGDLFMRIAAFVLVFAPAGAALSLDRRRALRRGEVAGPPAPVAPWAQRLLQLQLAALYLTTAIDKSHGATWIDGTALHYALRLEDFARFPVPVLPDLPWAIQLATWGTLALEFALGTLVFVRELRYPILLGGVALHAGIGWAMNIPFFGLLMVITYVLFVEPRHLEAALARARTAARRLAPLRARPIV